jgi:hypothetical protein
MTMVTVDPRKPQISTTGVGISAMLPRFVAADIGHCG